MEVSAFTASSLSSTQAQSLHTDVMDLDVDMALSVASVDDDTSIMPTIHNTLVGNVSPPTPEVDEDYTIVHNKVHIRGLNEMTAKDLQLTCSEHTASFLQRIEWINDTSANLVYEDADSASEALLGLTVTPAEGQTSLQLRPAKSPSSCADASLQVRLAVSTDRKQPRAHETSRFYLLHPEHDPRETRRRRRSNHGDQKYRRRHYNDEEHTRRKRKDLESGFDASMYDDVSAPNSAYDSTSAPRSVRTNDSHRPRRNRSASPQSLLHSRNQTLRSRSPLRNRGKELLPSRAARGAQAQDLFSEGFVRSTPGNKADLFPNKTPLSNHRRTDAIDAAADPADLFANRMHVPFTDGSSDTKTLAERVSGSVDPGQRDSMKRSPDDEQNGFVIKGLSSQGTTIRGTAASGNSRELFPEKSVRKDLFAGKFRRTPRLTAEDMFS